MAIKKTLTQAVPYSTDGKVTRWSLTMRYEQGTEGKDGKSDGRRVCAICQEAGLVACQE